MNNNIMVTKVYITLGFTFWLALLFILWPYALMIISLIVEHNWKIIPLAILTSYFMYSISCGLIRIVIFRKGHLTVIGEATPLIFLKKQYGFRLSINKINEIEIQKTLRDINSKGELMSNRPVLGFDTIIFVLDGGERHILFIFGYTKKQKKSIINSLISCNPNIVVKDKRKNINF